MCTYVYIYIHMYTYVHVCRWGAWKRRVHMYTYICPTSHICIYVSMCVFIYMTHMCVYRWGALTCVCADEARENMSISMCIFIYIYNSVYIPLYLQLNIHKYKWISMSMYMESKRPIKENILQKTPIILSILLTVVTPYQILVLCVAFHRSLLQNIVSFIGLFCKRDP